jgi:putative phosphoribosyl transferase
MMCTLARFWQKKKASKSMGERLGVNSMEKMTLFQHRDVSIPSHDGKFIKGRLDLPPDAVGLVIFAHGSGSGRLSPRNQFVARELQAAGIATLLIDLLTDEEAENRRNVFDIDLLSKRLASAATWASEQEETAELPVGYFGASTGAGAALVAAADNPRSVSVVVSRGGRPDLAENHLPKVKCPTLLIVGELDHEVILLNRKAQSRLKAESRLKIVPGATHLFEEPGTLEQAAELAKDWFIRHFGVRAVSKVQMIDLAVDR